MQNKTSKNNLGMVFQNLQIRKVPSTAEILPCIVTKPAFPAFCSSVEPTESNVPAVKMFFMLSGFSTLIPFHNS